MLATDDFRAMLLAELDSTYRLAMHLTRHPDEAADLVQETFLRALRAQKTFQLRDREKGVRPWLFKILHNAFYTRVERQKREPTLGDDLAHEAMPSELDHPPPAWDLASLDWEQVDDRLKAAIFDLPVHYRAPLLLWGVEGMKYREIAEVLEVPLGTVMSRLYRARGILSERLASLAVEHGIDPRQAPTGGRPGEGVGE